jgi:asparagine synthase (glutamine-hydrolysing)
MAEGILFSAGTDTSIIAFEAVKHNPDLKALTVEFEHGTPKDTQYVKKMVEFLNLNHEFLTFGHEEMVAAAEKVVQIGKTFDPMGIRNNIPIYLGLFNLKKKGIRSVFTGDALDELFGYPWQFHLSENEFRQELSNMWNFMQFSSTFIGKAIGVQVTQPFLERTFMEFAKKVPIKLKVNKKDGIIYGKWLIRRAYDGFIPNEVVWRTKAPCEQGTGTEILPKYFEEIIANQEFEKKKKMILNDDQVNLSSKEQLFYYKIFKKKFGIPSEVYNLNNGKECPMCKGYIVKNTIFCRICGAYPI